MEKSNTDNRNFYKWLWKKNNDAPMAEKFLRSVLQIIFAIIYDIKQGQLSLRAMSLVYTTLISLVPLFAISFSVLKGLGVHNQIRPFLLNALDALGDKKIEITEKIIGFVDNIQVGVLGALGIAILIYTVIGMMQKIELSFNYVWCVSKSRSFAKRVNDYLSILFVAPLLVFLSTAMTASAKTSYIVDKISNIYGFDILVAIIGVILPYVILALAFTFLYSFVPNTKVKFKAAFISGLITAFIWKLMGWGFANFIANSANHMAVYSAFATIIVFMIWIYLVWFVLLIGANIGFYIQYPERRRLSHNSVNISSGYKEAMAVQIMINIAKRFESHQNPAETDVLSYELGQPQHVIELICGYLKKSGIILNEEGNNAWIPAQPLDHISVYEIIRAARNNVSNIELEVSGKEAQEYLKEIDSLLSDKFKKKLRELI